MKPKTRQQEKSYHKGFQNIADLLVENNVTLAKVIEKLEVRPTASTVKDIFRSIAQAKYGIESTSDLESNQVTEVWEDLIKAVSETTAIFIPFPAKENTDEYINSLDR